MMEDIRPSAPESTGPQQAIAVSRRYGTCPSVMEETESHCAGYVFRSLRVGQKEGREERHVDAVVQTVSRRLHRIAIEVHRNATVEYLHDTVLEARSDSKFLRLHTERPLDLFQGWKCGSLVW